MSGRRVIFGTVLLGVANIFKLGVQFAVLPILARLLAPSAYGLVALAMPFIFFANIFSDAGLSRMLIRRDSVTPALESTVFWISTAISGSLALCVCAIAWPMAMIVHQPGEAVILLALAPILVLSGMTAAPTAKIWRQQRFAVFAVSDVVSAGGGAAVAIVAALHGWGAWSLVAQQVTLWTVRCVWLMLASRSSITPTCRPSLLKGSWAFGANLVGLSFLDFASRNIDNILIGAVLGVAALGQYSMAYQVMRMPEIIIAGPVYTALFSTLSRLKTDRETFNRIGLACLTLVSTVVLPVFGGLAVVSDLAVGTILGPKWGPAAIVLVMLAPAGVAFCTFCVLGAMLSALGRAAVQLRMAMIITGGTAVGVLVGTLDHTTGVAMGVSAAMVVAAVPFVLLVSRETQTPALRLLTCFNAPGLATTVMIASVLGFRSIERSMEPTLMLVACIAIGALAYIVTLGLVSGPQLLREAKFFLSARKGSATLDSAAISTAEPLVA
jgi:PST family polysaccharide transporter